MSAQWFDYPHLLRAYLLDCIKFEFPAARIDKRFYDPTYAMGEISLGESGLGLDSLELIKLSALISRYIHINESHVADNFLDKPTLSDWEMIVRSSLQQYSDQISFKTSGSTGAQKYRAHSLYLLEEESQFLSKGLSNRRRILKAVPSHHIYGFIFTVLLPTTMHITHSVVDIRGQSANSLTATLQAGDLIIGFPEFWEHLDASGIIFPDDVIGINSAGPCSADISNNLYKKNISQFIEVYGSSETAGVGWRKKAEDPYLLFPYWHPGAERTKLVRSLVSGDSLTVEIQDNLDWTSDQSFFVIGRKDNVVQVGGMNVNLTTVAHTLKQHPLIQDVIVRKMQPHEGDRLKAFIVIQHDHQVFKDDPDRLSVERLTDDINQYIHQVLPDVERPKSITLGFKLPMNEMGKLGDW